MTVTESIPETLEVHRGNHVVLSTPVNTGVPGAETAQGTFPIFSRFVSTTMAGTNPDGTQIRRAGRAVGQLLQRRRRRPRLSRASYGTPQSNGCVELPIETAQTVYRDAQDRRHRRRRVSKAQTLGLAAGRRVDRPLPTPGTRLTDRARSSPIAVDRVAGPL